MKSLNVNNLLKIRTQIFDWSNQFYNDESSEYDSKLASLASCITASIEEFYENYISDDALSDMAFLHIK